MIVIDCVEQDQVIDYKKIVTDVYHEVCKLPNDGKIATYIPELANVDANKFGVSLTTIGGQTKGFRSRVSARCFLRRLRFQSWAIKFGKE
jgi:Glutaminase